MVFVDVFLRVEWLLTDHTVVTIGELLLVFEF